MLAGSLPDSLLTLSKNSWTTWLWQCHERLYSAVMFRWVVLVKVTFPWMPGNQRTSAGCRIEMRWLLFTPTGFNVVVNRCVVQAMLCPLAGRVIVLHCSSRIALFTPLGWIISDTFPPRCDSVLVLDWGPVWLSLTVHSFLSHWMRAMKP